MNSYEELNAASKTIDVQSAFAYLAEINAKQKFKIQSPFPPIAGLTCEIEKGSRCFKYKTSLMNRNISLVEYQSKQYGLRDRMALVNDKWKFDLPKGTGTSSIMIGQGFRSSGELDHIEYQFDTAKRCFFKALVPFPKYRNKLMDYVQSSAFNVATAFRGSGYIRLALKHKNVAIFDYKNGETDYFFIECYNKIRYEEFEELLGAVCYTSGLITGTLIRDEVYIVQSKSVHFKSFTGFQYRRVEDSLGYVSAIAPRIYKEYHQLTKTEYMPAEIFANLISKCLDDKRLLRAIKLITESGNTPLPIRAASYSVALETLKNIIIEENQDKINPIDSNYSRKVVLPALLDVIETLDQSKFLNKNMVINKIKQLNQIGNTESFLKSYSLLNIVLEPQEEITIGLRNDFLHGRIPFEDEEITDQYSLQKITLQLHLLLCALVLKYAGYNGYLINNMTLISLQNKIETKDALFRKI